MIWREGVERGAGKLVLPAIAEQDEAIQRTADVHIMQTGDLLHRRASLAPISQMSRDGT